MPVWMIYFIQWLTREKRWFIRSLVETGLRDFTDLFEENTQMCPIGSLWHVSRGLTYDCELTMNLNWIVLLLVGNLQHHFSFSGTVLVWT